MRNLIVALRLKHDLSEDHSGSQPSPGWLPSNNFQLYRPDLIVVGRKLKFIKEAEKIVKTGMNHLVIIDFKPDFVLPAPGIAGSLRGTL